MVWDGNGGRRSAWKRGGGDGGGALTLPALIPRGPSCAPRTGTASSDVDKSFSLALRLPMVD